MTGVTGTEIKNLLKLEKTYLKAVLKAVGKRKKPNLDPRKCPPCMQAHYLEDKHGTPSCLICSMAGHENYNAADRCIILTNRIYFWNGKSGEELKEIKALVKKYLKLIEKNIIAVRLS